MAVDVAVRGANAYALAREAIAHMETHKVWPTPLNFELWLHYCGEPDGDLAKELERLLASGEPFTDDLSETLAAAFLPRIRLSEELRDAGAQLSRELRNVAAAIVDAQRSQSQYGDTLSDASRTLADSPAGGELERLVSTLTQATKTVQEQSTTLEKKLHESTREVSHLREHLDQVRREAMTDALTSLANRKALDEHLARVCSEASMTGKPLTLAVLDIDHFKRFNDTWGHQTGDQVIRYVASVLGRMATPPRFSARFGGEEFAMVFVGEPAPAALRVLEQIRVEIGSRSLKRRSTNEDLGAVTISIGLAQLHKGESMTALIERADAALYLSKRNGRNRTTNAEALNVAA